MEEQKKIVPNQGVGGESGTMQMPQQPGINGQEAQQVPQGMQQAPAGYAVNPQTGQMVYTGQEAQQVPQQQSMQQAPAGYAVNP
ncbi:MAG: hypothetical protein CSB24_02885, partial [Deltaproteobacteria bacterium]